MMMVCVIWSIDGLEDRKHESNFVPESKIGHERGREGLRDRLTGGDLQ